MWGRGSYKQAHGVSFVREIISTNGLNTVGFVWGENEVGGEKKKWWVVRKPIEVKIG